jgi:hypothetical protein
MVPRVVICCWPDVPEWRAQINLPMQCSARQMQCSAPDRSDRGAVAGQRRNHGVLRQSKPAPAAIHRSGASMPVALAVRSCYL